MAALNDLEVKAGDIQNAYLTAPNAEKTWTTCGPEFGADEGKKALIVRAVYGHKSSRSCISKPLGRVHDDVGVQVMLSGPRCVVQGDDKARRQVPLLLLHIVVC